jgi:hypothetical protein
MLISCFIGLKYIKKPLRWRPYQLWVPASLLSNGYWGLFNRGLSGRGVNLTTHLHLVPRSRMVELYLHSPVCLHGIVLDWLSTGTTLSLFRWRAPLFRTPPFVSTGILKHSLQYKSQQLLGHDSGVHKLFSARPPKIATFHNIITCEGGPRLKWKKHPSPLINFC